MLKKTYEYARTYYGCTQDEFLCGFNRAQQYLYARYGGEYVSPDGGGMRRVSSVEEELPVREEFVEPILDAIAADKTGDEKKMVDFVTKCDYCYRTLWRQKMRGRRIRRAAI